MHCVIIREFDIRDRNGPNDLLMIAVNILGHVVHELTR